MQICCTIKKGNQQVVNQSIHSVDNPKTSISDEFKNTLIENMLDAIMMIHIIKDVFNKHVLELITDGGHGVVNTVDGSVDKLLVALSDSAAMSLLSGHFYINTYVYVCIYVYI